MPGLVIDRFGDTLTVQIGTAGLEKQCDAILAALDKVLAPPPSSCAPMRRRAHWKAWTVM